MVTLSPFLIEPAMVSNIASITRPTAACDSPVCDATAATSSLLFIMVLLDLLGTLMSQSTYNHRQIAGTSALGVLQRVFPRVFGEVGGICIKKLDRFHASVMG